MSSQSHVAHHFDTAEQQFDAAKLGMWLFLGQEILFFSALFVAYAVFRYLYPEMFFEASTHLSWQMGAINTVFLITSSFTMALAIREQQLDRQKNSFLLLGATLFFAFLFLIIKYFEYAEKISHGYLPSLFFSGHGDAETMPIFFGIYFFMTGLHAVHVLIGMGLIVWLMIRSAKKQFSSENYTALEMSGLYWHLVDLIWIFLFPLLYLM